MTDPRLIEQIDPRSPAEIAKAEVAVGRKPASILEMCRCGEHRADHPPRCRCQHRFAAHDAGRLCLAKKCPCLKYDPRCLAYEQDPAWQLPQGFLDGHRVFPVEHLGRGALMAVGRHRSLPPKALSKPSP